MVDVRGRTLLAVPTVCALIAVTLLVVDHFERLNLLAIALATLTLAGVLTRLWLTFRENRSLLRQSTDEAVTDALTGLGNRRRLMGDLDDAMAAATVDEPWLLAIYDLDGFKGYNDAFGHPAGDALLARLGEKLAGVNCRPTAAAIGSAATSSACSRRRTPRSQSRLLDDSLEALCERGEGFSVTSSFGAVLLPEHASEGIGGAPARQTSASTSQNAESDRRGTSRTRCSCRRFYDASPTSTRGPTTSRSSPSPSESGSASNEAKLAELQRAAMLHDIGKIAIPDQILHKPGALDDAELAFVRKHTVVGERIVSASPALRPVGGSCVPRTSDGTAPDIRTSFAATRSCWQQGSSSPAMHSSR